MSEEASKHECVAHLLHLNAVGVTHGDAALVQAHEHGEGHQRAAEL